MPTSGPYTPFEKLSQRNEGARREQSHMRCSESWGQPPSPPAPPTEELPTGGARRGLLGGGRRSQQGTHLWVFQSSFLKNNWLPRTNLHWSYKPPGWGVQGRSYEASFPQCLYEGHFGPCKGSLRQQLCVSTRGCGRHPGRRGAPRRIGTALLAGASLTPPAPEDGLAVGTAHGHLRTHLGSWPCPSGEQPASSEASLHYSAYSAGSTFGCCLSLFYL